MKESVFILCNSRYKMGVDEFHEGIVMDKHGNKSLHVGVVMFVCLILGISVIESKKHVDDWWEEQESKYSDKIASWTIS